MKKFWLKLLLGVLAEVIEKVLDSISNPKLFAKTVELAQPHVAMMEAVLLPGEQKRQEVTTRVQADLRALGLSASQSLINYAIETAVTIAKKK